MDRIKVCHRSRCLDRSVPWNTTSGSYCTTKQLEERCEIQEEIRNLLIQNQLSNTEPSDCNQTETDLDVSVDEVFGPAPIDPLSPADLGLLRYRPLGLGPIAVVPDVDLTVDLAARPASSFGELRN